MRCRDLEEIREKIACPQFGDNHYGEWGALRLEQRETILRLITELRFLRGQYYYELPTTGVMKAIDEALEREKGE